MTIHQNGQDQTHMRTRKKVTDIPEDIAADIKVTQGRLKYVRKEVKHWDQPTAARATGLHKRTIGNYETKQDPFGIEIRKIIKKYGSTFAYFAGEIDDPGPDPFKAMQGRNLTAHEKKLLDLCEIELNAAIRLRENSQKEFEAAQRYRQEYERINNISMELTNNITMSSKDENKEPIVT